MKIGIIRKSKTDYRTLNPSSHSYRPSLVRVRQRPLVQPVKIEIEGVRWVAVRTAVASERRVTEVLNGLGFRAYCPLGCKIVTYQAGPRARKSVVRQFPILCRYIFVGLPPGAVLDPTALRLKGQCDKIEAVYGGKGYVFIPPEGIEYFNRMELSGEWDDTIFRPQKSAFQPGTRVRIVAGPMTHFLATVDVLESEDRIRVIISAFGHDSPVTYNLDEVQLVA